MERERVQRHGRSARERKAARRHTRHIDRERGSRRNDIQIKYIQHAWRVYL